MYDNYDEMDSYETIDGEQEEYPDYSYQGEQQSYQPTEQDYQFAESIQLQKEQFKDDSLFKSFEDDINDIVVKAYRNGQYIDVETAYNYLKGKDTDVIVENKKNEVAFNAMCSGFGNDPDEVRKSILRHNQRTTEREKSHKDKMREAFGLK